MNKRLIEEISKHQLAIHTDETTYSAEHLRLIKRSYRPSLGRGVGQSRRVENITWSYLSASDHFTSDVKETCLTDFGDLLPVNE